MTRGPSLMGTKVLLRWCVLFTAPLHQGDTSGLQTTINRKHRQRRFTYARILKRCIHCKRAFRVKYGWNYRETVGRKTIICLVKKWGLMIAQQREGARINLSQSMSRNMTGNLQLSSCGSGVILSDQKREMFSALLQVNRVEGAIVPAMSTEEGKWSAPDGNSIPR